MAKTLLRPQHQVVIPAPDAATAFMLEKRVVGLEPAVRGHGDDWRVELSADDGALEEVETAVRRWLREEAIREVAMRVDGEARTIRP